MAADGQRTTILPTALNVGGSAVAKAETRQPLEEIVLTEIAELCVAS